MTKPFRPFDFDHIDPIPWYWTFRSFMVHRVWKENLSPSAIQRHIKWFFQRRRRGFDDRELWNLDHTFAKFVLPRLKAFKKINIGYPADLTVDEWNEKLDQMIWSFEYAMSYYNDVSFLGHNTDKMLADQKKSELGLKVFAEYFSGLWD